MRALILLFLLPVALSWLAIQLFGGAIGLVLFVFIVGIGAVEEVLKYNRRQREQASHEPR